MTAPTLEEKLNQFKSIHTPVEWTDPQDPSIATGIIMVIQVQTVRYYPLISFVLCTLFIFYYSFVNEAATIPTQNQVWAGMAKETAHQLGTPVSSLEGWVEMLKEGGNRATEKLYRN